jgi:hypothetical protein
MATLSSKMLPAGVATLAQGALADTSVQPNDSPAFDALTVNGNAYPSAGALSNRNLVINGEFSVAQRATSVTGSTTTGYKACDRFEVGNSFLGAWTFSQDSDVPAGFSKSFKAQCTTADAAPAAGDYIFFNTYLEGQNLQQLKKGLPTAQSTTLSFWVKSNKTGAFQVNLNDLDNTRIIGAAVTISVAATWEYKTITFAGDVTGALDNDNSRSIAVEFWLGAGTSWTSGAVPTAWEARVDADRAAGTTLALADNIANYINVTGVQLEVGDTATPFEHRGFGQELALCQRYARLYPISRLTMCPEGSNGDNTQTGIQYSPMRATPSSTTLTTPTSVVNGAGQGAVPTFNVVPQSITDAAVQAQGITASAYGASVLLLTGSVFLDAEL